MQRRSDTYNYIDRALLFQYPVRYFGMTRLALSVPGGLRAAGAGIGSRCVHVLWLGGAKDGAERVMSSVALGGFEGCRDMKSKANWERETNGLKGADSVVVFIPMRRWRQCAANQRTALWTRDARCVRRS